MVFGTDDERDPGVGGGITKVPIESRGPTLHLTSVTLHDDSNPDKRCNTLPKVSTILGEGRSVTHGLDTHVERTRPLLLHGKTGGLSFW